MEKVYIVFEEFIVGGTYVDEVLAVYTTEKAARKAALELCSKMTNERHLHCTFSYDINEDHDTDMVPNTPDSYYTKNEYLWEREFENISIQIKSFKLKE